MKKRLAVGFIAIVLLMTATMTAFAQPSSEAGPITIISATDKDNKDVKNGVCHEVRIGELKGTELEDAKNIVKPENLKTVLSEADAKKNWTSFMQDVYLWDVDDRKEVDWAEAEYHFPVTVTFKVPGVTPKSHVEVLHYYQNWHTEDKVKDVKVGDGTVTVTFAHLSPVVILVENPKTPSAPQTGESNIALYVALVAVVAVAGAVATKKKANS